MQGDTICDRCGAPEESINHVFFECPPAIQAWALLRIPTNPDIFLTQSLFKYGSFILVSLPGNRRSSFCIDSMVYMEMTKQ